MGLKDQIALDADVFFNSYEIGEDMTLNSSLIVGIVKSKGYSEDYGCSFDYLDVVINAEDISSVSYRSDKLVLNNETWGFPKLLERTAYTYTLQFRKNERPLVSIGRK
jgi:hypothetical protein